MIELGAVADGVRTSLANNEIEPVSQPYTGNNENNLGQLLPISPMRGQNN